MDTTTSKPTPYETAQKLMQLIRRAQELAVKAQSVAAAKATGSDFSLVDLQTVSTAYLKSMAELSRNPAEVVSTAQQAWLGAVRAWSDAWAGTSQGVSDRRFRDADWDADPVSQGAQPGEMTAVAAAMRHRRTKP